MSKMTIEETIKQHVRHMNSCRICREENITTEEVDLDIDNNFAERTKKKAVRTIKMNRCPCGSIGGRYKLTNEREKELIENYHLKDE